MANKFSVDAYQSEGGTWFGRIWQGKGKRRKCREQKAGFPNEADALAWARQHLDATLAHQREEKAARQALAAEVRAQRDAETLFAWSDGACAGNPGRMGIGGIIKNADGKVLAMFSDLVWHGTNNEAEYLAATRAIELAAQVGSKYLVLHSDSDLVVQQFLGTYAVNKPHLRRLCDAMHKAARVFNGRIDVEWTPRHGNTEADALASRAVGMPQAPLGGDKLFWLAAGGHHPDPTELAALPSSPKSLKAFLRINKPKFRDFCSLRIGGIDGYSRLGQPECERIIAVRHGPDAVEWLLAAFGQSCTDAYRNSALRWCARGLPPDLALKKASVDTEIAAKANG